MSNEATNFEVGNTESYGNPEVLATATVTEVNTSTKTVSVTMDDLPKLDELPPEMRAEKVVDGEQLEKDMLAKEAQKAEQMDPLEIASMMLTIYTPRFISIVDKLSNRQLKRLMKSLVEFPVGKTYVHNDPLEKEGFALGKNLMDAKYVLIANTYNVNRERIFEEAAKAAANIETSFTEPTNEEGQNNGR